MSLIYNIPMGQPFLRQLATGIMTRFGNQTLHMGEVVVLLPTQRGCLSLKEIFREKAQGQTLILPRIYALADLEKEPILPGFLPQERSLPQKVISRWERVGHLMNLVQQFLRQKNLCHTPAVAYPLAQELATLLDEFYISDVELSRLNTLVVEDFSIYWQQNLNFLKIISDYWPMILREQNLIEPVQFQQQNLKMIATHWRPSFPVILAGTTGTRPATAQLARSLLRWPQGMVVLPGFDIHCEDSVGPTHPNYTLTKFVEFLEIPPTTIQSWCSKTSPKAEVKATLLKQAMAPLLTVRDPNLGSLSQEELSVFPISCSTQEEEALVIAAILRKVYEKEQGTAALITPDQKLTRRVQAYLKRWGIIPNVSAGTSLNETVVGTFFNLITRINPEMAMTDWVALLKHPLFFKADDRGMHLNHVRQLEKEVLRQKRGVKVGDHHLIPESLQPWYHRILTVVNPLLEPLSSRSFPQWLTLHIDIVFQIAGDYLWRNHDGEAAKSFFEELIKEATTFPLMGWKDYTSLLGRLMSQVSVHHKEGIGSPLKILGTLEARQTDANLIILAGLNEGVWPQAIDEGTWLSNQMRLKLGLPSAQRRLGLSAHDFCLGFSAKEVYLTRSEQCDSRGATPSRLWMRFLTILKQCHFNFHEAENLLALVRELDKSEEIKPMSAPHPIPPTVLKPKQYSVTDIERLLRDPYSIYAKNILKLKKIEPLDQPLTARDWGRLVHQILDLTFQHHHPKEGKKFVKALKQMGQNIFSPYWGDVNVQVFWWHRFEKICNWIGQVNDLKNVQTFQSEVPGQIELEIGEERIRLTTIADRIDQLTEGVYQVVDYKTGRLPTDNDISLGFSPQMALEGLILQKGGFQLPVAVDLKAVYWVLQGGVEAGDIKNFNKIKNKNYTTLVEEAAAGIQELLTYFHKEGAIYLSCPWGKDKVRFEDYWHLARGDEWIM